MFAKLEDWLFNAFAGKLLARAALTVASYVAGPVVQGFAAKAGVHVSVDPTELQAAMILAAHAGFEWLKAHRQPQTPTVLAAIASAAPKP